MPFLNNIEQLRSVGNWATTYLWDIKFSDFNNKNTSCPYPFDEWFPASSVEEPIYHIETYTINAHVLTTEIPKNTGLRQISIECYDDYNHSLENWLRYWFKDMFNDYNDVKTLFEVVKKLEVQRLNPQRELLHTNRYYVFPKGSLNVSQNSQSSSKKLNFTLAVVGSELVGDSFRI